MASTRFSSVYRGEMIEGLGQGFERRTIRKRTLAATESKQGQGTENGKSRNINRPVHGQSKFSYEIKLG